ncbi:ribonucleoside-diphosphate reductase, adenosylcobalamin-dependent [Paenibacillus sp. BGI2013]|uniref:adenosylcobalamin-dependent ribonucleoside-diphosphate reductase n=1 Tax=Paenibacillus TaxID=44249 RepID=UPI00097018B4|nr:MULTISPECIES: adenosylcobalamin-dependent ribonucleoside-diphosphate reductase [Paenibacillus]OMF48106.1 ribonucleoside-diphosphate reductase, adenosylcobalamin-dependent [Paenibacillus amylolyticus]PKQ92945.1 ribonucleoside-diphosphate reductase, adenosylcobalamin-dependent [Paenibacillus sp. BGI2013]
MKSNQRSYQLEGLSEKIFLDRYAWKDADSNHAKVGDVVLVLTKDDPKFPTKEVGEIIERQGQLVQVRTRSGEMIETSVEKLTLNIEKTPEEMWDRLAKAMASVESTADKRATWESKFRSVLEDWKLVPGGRIAAGAGASDELTLFNCYVIPSPQDSRGGIMKTLTEMTEIMARGGGVGINLSSLRPRRAVVKGVNGSSSGSVSWGGLFSYTTGLIEQGGSRRGALMLMMNDWHPDVLDFITVKQTMGQVTNANLSVCVSNAFMEAVKQDGDWDLVFPDTNDPDYDTEWNGDMQQWKAAGHSVVHYRTLKARKIWHTIIESAWKSAEPGVVFMEYYNQMSNSWYFNPIICTNPCGEQGLPGWGVCNLSAINLSKFYDETNHDVAWDELAETTRISTRFLDNVIDATPYHFEENRLNQQRERRVGLGTMGLAELMIKLRIRYGSPESLVFLDKLYGFMAKEAYLASAQIAAEKGAFPAFEAEPYLQSGFMKNMVATYPEVGEAIRKQGIRNVTLITQAPTGSTGTMVGTSTGIEPYFAFKYFRQSRLGYDEQFVPIAQDWLDEHPGEALPDYYVTAMDLSAENHIRVQAAIQQWVDSSISKTANCPADFTVEDTAELYELAFDLGCKGVTIYRDGSRDVQVLSTSKKEETQGEDQNTAEAEEKTVVSAIENPNNAEVQASDGTSNSQVGVRTHSSDQAPSSSTVLDKQYRSRPQVLRGATYKINTPFGMAYITINDLEGTPGEIFLNVGKAGSDVFAMAEALGRVCSLFLRYGDHGQKVELLIKHLKGIGGSGAIGFGANRVESIADAVAKALESHVQSDVQENKTGALQEQSQVESTYPKVEDQKTFTESRDLCPSCGSASLMNVEGCRTCSNCGYSKCN